jgi:uncharacterized damage-inducible protein DinB
MAPMNTTAPSLKQAAVGDLENEIATTRRVLERVRDEHLDWKPHAKSMALGGLATHLATLPTYGSKILGSDELDFATRMPPNPIATTRDEVLSRFDAAVADLRALMEAADDTALATPWTLRRGEQIVLRHTKAGMLRTFFLSHMIQHRGQLSVYLRLLDIPVPSIYGPSADEGGF